MAANGKLVNPPSFRVLKPVCQRLPEVIYSVGWRLVASPNFGGDSLDWPCLLFKRPTKTTEAPTACSGFGGSWKFADCRGVLFSSRFLLRMLEMGLGLGFTKAA